MACHRIYRMKEHQRQQFRWAPHASGVTPVKPKDYEPAGSVEAASPYAAWNVLKDTDMALQVGDLLEIQGGGLRIYKYVGFEEAQWVLPEIQTGAEALPPAAGQPSSSVPCTPRQ